MIHVFLCHLRCANERIYFRHVHRYFDRLSSKSCMERNNIFIQTSPDLFQDSPATMFPIVNPLTAADIQVRRERQTFTKLEKSDAVLFTVRTFMKPLVEIENGEVEGLAAMIRAWQSTELGPYKGSTVWGDVTLKWCDERMAADASSKK